MSTKQDKPIKSDKACLICEKSQKTLRKGLCPSHYAQYSRARELAIAKGLDPEEFDSDLVAQGLLREDGRNASNPFASALAKFEAKRDVAKAQTDLQERREKQ